MNPTALVFGLGSSSLFASRAFVPAFLTSLFLRFGDRLPFLSDLPLFGDLGGEPTWFTHGAVIAALGILAALEVAATKSPEADEALAIVDQYLKVGMAILCTLGVLTSADKGFIEETIAPAQQGASLLGTLVLPFVGVVVFFLAGLRADLKEVLFEMDEDDDLGLRKLLSWAEDSWVLAGTLVLILYPLVMIVILGVVFGVMHMIRKYLERREDRSKTPCEGCGEAVYACALECHACHKETAEPHVIGFFGQSRDTVVTDREQHALDLAEKRRCPACATRLRERNPRQICTQCGHQVFGETTFEK
ncbi:MAG: DUF4126 domain-containing protein, partial [Lentisphaeria bacterium]|nr:DUF4126 domain-containing protein [Lentisphaeria bacterium]